MIANTPDADVRVRRVPGACVRTALIMLAAWFAPTWALAGQGTVTLNDVPSGTTNVTHPVVQVYAAGGVSYKFSINGSPYSVEKPIGEPIVFAADVHIGGQTFAAGSRELAEFINGRTAPGFPGSFLSSFALENVQAPLQITYLVNRLRAAVAPHNVLNVAGQLADTLGIDVIEKAPPGDRYELTRFAVTGGVLEQAADQTRHFVLRLAPSSEWVDVTAWVNNSVTTISLNGSPSAPGATVRIARPPDGAAINIRTAGPDGSRVDYDVEVMSDASLSDTAYRGFYLRAFDPSASFFKIQNGTSANIEYSLSLNGRFGSTKQQLLREIEEMAPEYPAEPLHRKAWRFVRDNRIHAEPLTPARWYHTPALFFGSAGFGFCDDAAAALYYLVTAFGYTARMWDLSGHVVTEVQIGGRWEMFDPDLQAYYRNLDGLVAGVQELAGNPQLITNPIEPLPIDPQAYSAAVAQIYGSQADNVVQTWLDEPASNPDLPMVFTIPAGGVFEFPDVYDSPLHVTDHQVAEWFANARLLVPSGFVGTIQAPLIIQSIGWSNTPVLSVIARYGTGEWDPTPTTAHWTIDAEAPFTTATQPAGQYTENEPLTLSANEPATIYYTKSATAGLELFSMYQGPIEIGHGEFVRYFAVDVLGNREQVRVYGPPDIPSAPPVLLSPGDRADGDAPLSYAATILAAGPIAYLRLGDSGGAVVVDSASGANPATVSGDVTFNQAGAIADGDHALRFNGTNGHVDLLPSASLAGDLTIELWINITASGRQTLISKGYLHEFELTLEEGGELNLYQGDGSNWQNHYTSAGVVIPGLWQHVVVVRDAASHSIRFYVNGVLKASAGYSLLPIDSATPVSIGRAVNGGAPVLGTIDEVALYTRPLSEVEIASHYLLRAANGTGTPIELQLIASDPDGRQLLFSADNLPSGLTIDAHTGVISGTLTQASVGQYAVTVTVWNGFFFTSQTFTWTVTHDNRPPVMAPPHDLVNAQTWNYPQAVMADSAQAYWRLGDADGATAADAVAGHSATRIGGIAGNQPGALADGTAAMLFDGASGYLSVPNPTSLPLAGDLSIELWINVSLQTRQTLISKHYRGEFELTLETNGQLNLYQGNGTTYAGMLSVAGAVRPNVWQHVVVTRSVATHTVRFYVNGVARGSRTWSITPAATSNPIVIGRSAAGVQYVNGRIDEVALYATALTAAQVTTHYNLAAVLESPTPVMVQLSASDPDGDALSYSASGLPPSLTLNPVTGLISGTLTTPGIFIVTATVSDGSLSASQTFTWTIMAGASNRPPTLINPGDQVSPDSYTYPQAVVADSAQAYWRLGDADGTTAVDTVGGHPATRIGGIAGNQPGALADGTAAMLFDGASGYLSVPNPTSLSLAGDLSIELWINVSLQTRQTLISKHYRGEFELTLETNGQLNLYQGNGTTYAGMLSAAGAVQPNVWQHVVVTRSVATHTVRFYVNGVARGGGTWSITPAATSNPIVIGRSAAGVQYVNGRIDEVALYTIALTAAQATAHYNLAAVAATPSSITLQLTATDPDGDPLTYTASGLPPTLTLNPATGLISGTTSTPGVYAVVVNVSDGSLTASQSFTWIVTHTN